MSSQNPIFTNDVGTIFRVTVTECDANDVLQPVDVSVQTAMSFRFLKPGGSVLAVTPVFTTDGTNGQIQYAVVADDLDEAGTWELQASVVLPTGDYGTTRVEFTVFQRI